MHHTRADDARSAAEPAHEGREFAGRIRQSEDRVGEYMPDDRYTDGNALAGPLSEVFAVDLTAARTRCTGCGATGPLARLRLYTQAPGLVARCPECGQVILRLVRDPQAVWLDLRGTVALTVPLDA